MARRRLLASSAGLRQDRHMSFVLPAACIAADSVGAGARARSNNNRNNNANLPQAGD
jgi:hypothetical protein